MPVQSYCSTRAAHRLLQLILLALLWLNHAPASWAASRASTQQNLSKARGASSKIKHLAVSADAAPRARSRGRTALLASKHSTRRPGPAVSTVRGRVAVSRQAPIRSTATAPRSPLVPATIREIAPGRPSIGEAIGLRHVDDPLDLRSSVAMVIDQRSGEALYQKNVEAVLPIASITKVMTAMVVLDTGLPLDEMLEVSDADRDTERHSSSRLPIGTRLTRNEMLHLALMSSENRAANALGRHFPGGIAAFVRAMNMKAASLGMADSRFADPTGLSSGNVSNARDLARMVRAAYNYDLIRHHSTDSNLQIASGRRQITFRSTNRLVRDPQWDIGMQKTGFISEAGKCLVMQARIDSRPVIMVLLDADSPQQRFSDAQRLKRWVVDQPRLPTRTETRS